MTRDGTRLAWTAVDPRLYMRVYEVLSRRITDGTLPAGTRLHIGRLADELDVSRDTVQRAIGLLSRRRPGAAVGGTRLVRPLAPAQPGPAHPPAAYPVPRQAEESAPQVAAGSCGEHQAGALLVSGIIQAAGSIVFPQACQRGLASLTVDRGMAPGRERVSHGGLPRLPGPQAD